MDEEKEGRAVAALNVGIILHRLTVSLHIMLKLLPGNEGREKRGLKGKVGEALKGSYNDHTLLSHSPPLPSAPCSLALARLASHFLSFHSEPGIFFYPLFLLGFVLCIIAGLGSFEGESALICFLSLAFLSLFS